MFPCTKHAITHVHRDRAAVLVVGWRAVAVSACTGERRHISTRSPEAVCRRAQFLSLRSRLVHELLQEENGLLLDFFLCGIEVADRKHADQATVIDDRNMPDSLLAQQVSYRVT